MTERLPKLELLFSAACPAIEPEEGGSLYPPRWNYLLVSEPIGVILPRNAINEPQSNSQQ
jgi:hypothetical protein